MSIFEASLSTHVTCVPNSEKHAPVTSPTYPVPTTAMFTVASSRFPPRRLAAEPRQEPLDAPVEIHGGLPVQLRARPGHVGPRPIDVPGLRREDPHAGRRGEPPGALLHEIGERRGARAAQVPYVVGLRPVERRDDPLDDVRHEGVVPRQGAVAELLDLPSR